MVKLGEVLTHRGEFITVDDLQSYRRVTAQLHAKGIILRDEVEGILLKTKKQRVCKGGDFLVAEIDAKVGGFGIVPPDLEGSIVSSHYFLFDIDTTKLVRKYLDFFIRTEDFQKQITARGSTNYAAIRPPDVLQLEIPLPPLEKQQRTVTTLELLMAKIENARKERVRAMEECILFLEKSRTKIFHNLSMEYECEYLENNADVQLGKMLSPRSKYGINPHPYLRNANVQWDNLELSDVKSMDFDEREITKFTLEKGDILVCEGGEIGRSAIWNNEIKDCLYQKALHRVRCKYDKIIPRFVLHALFWGQKSGKFFDLKTQTTIAHLPAIKLKKFPFPVPPLPEQRSIVAHLDCLQAKVDEVKRLQMETEREMVELVPAVLVKAFGGEA
ncbi:MAG: restriction endonuclease subunit S [Methanoregula sp.]|nr:restriction endonuclease subunit S [Methanoregula sp.]